MNNLNEIGTSLINIGLYLSVHNENDYKNNTQIKENIINYLLQAYLYLREYDKSEIVNNINTSIETQQVEYLSRKQVIEMYYPLITDYGLTQLIHTKGFPHIKRGNKYFFNKDEIDKWLKENGNEHVNKVVKFV